MPINPVTQDDVRKIASLARLNPQGEELHQLTNDFNQILKFVGQIAEVDISSVSDALTDSELMYGMREDIPGKSVPIEDLRKIAPEFEAGFFVVPRVIESDG